MLAECVQVAVSNATFHFDKLYSYSVPAPAGQSFCGQHGSCPVRPRRVGWRGARTGCAGGGGKRLKSLTTLRLNRRACRRSCCVWSISRNTFCTYYEGGQGHHSYGAQYKAVNTGPVPQRKNVRHTEPVYRRTDALAGTPYRKAAGCLGRAGFRPQNTEGAGRAGGVTKAGAGGPCEKKACWLFPLRIKA